MSKLRTTNKVYRDKVALDALSKAKSSVCDAQKKIAKAITDTERLLTRLEK